MLVKTTHATHPTDYVACYELSEEEKLQIYEIIRTLNPEDYPDVYDPQEGECMSEPSMTLVLTVKSNGTEKAISAKDIAYDFTAKNKKGQAFLTACDKIKTLLIETEEWKALPDYEFKYEQLHVDSPGLTALFKAFLHLSQPNATPVFLFGKTTQINLRETELPRTNRQR